MRVADLVAELERVGVLLWEESGNLHYRAPRDVMTDSRRAALRSQKDAVLEHLRAAAEDAAAVPDPGARHEPFPLTDVQSAYLIGRRSAFDYGGVACHAYAELSLADLDTARLEAAWQALVRRHDMLRAVIDVTGFQRVLPDVPDYRIQVADLRGAHPGRIDAMIAATRAEMDHQVHETDRWPLFELRATLTDGGARLHFSIDFLIADYVSIHLVLDELHQIYADPARPLPPLAISFRDYLLAERRLRTASRYERDREYWWRRIDDLPVAPELPVRVMRAAGAAARFRRHELTLSPEEWSALRRRAGCHGVTASGAVLCAYAEVIVRWSRRPRFTLDVTLLNRFPLHPQVGQLVGDFTSVDLLAVEYDPAARFRERAQALQARLWEDLDHRLCSGIEVMRELARRRGRCAALMPIVFTSAIGLKDEGCARGIGEALGQLVHGISQTPQVWIDCQVMERRGALAINWDVREGVFPDGLVEDMFPSFERVVRRLAAEDEVWELASPVPLPEAQRDRRRRVNATAAPISAALLHEEVVAQALRDPERLAVVSDRRSLCFGELLGRAAAVSAALHAAGCDPRDVVAVVMDKGWEQVVAVLGTLLAGAVYLPVDTNQPWARRAQMMDDAQVRYVLTQSWIAPTDGWPEGAAAIAVDTLAPAPTAAPKRAVCAEDLAYVIYTSGSMGKPKGVMMSHRSALNTVSDVNRRFGVGPGDRVLGLANLGFDLSVYDIFGPLAVGGCLVLPDADSRSDPSRWTEFVAAHGVTLWNSVPAQLQMLHDYLITRPALKLPSLRLALLSGDWIPIGLPDAIRSRLPGIELVSLGGATEAAIWSISYPIGRVQAEWRSIPYGKPLTNQSFHVLDAALRSCPDWATGELYIGGAGLAMGYLGDEAKTARRFIRHAETGERLYRTGDLGRYLPDDNIELLGREDLQVKMRGHRVELAEIEAALQAHGSVARSAVISVEGEPPLERRLAAFVESARRGADQPPEAAPARLIPAARAAGDEVLSAVDRTRYLAYTRSLDDVALLAMLRALQSQALFATPEDTHTLGEILDAADVAPRHHRLVRRWLRALEDNGMLGRDPQGSGYRGARAVDATTLEGAWRRVDELQRGIDDERPLVEYFRASAECLPALLRGEVDALQLLFPGGRLDVADTLYRSAFFNRWANRVAAAALRQIATHASAPRPLRVLEIGAGAGGMTADVIAAIDGLDVDYLFTDLSRFFLNEARDRFGAYLWVRYGVFDLDRDPRAQGMVPNAFDVVLAGDVLHNAADVAQVLARLRELTRPGGWLVLVEMTRDHYQIMTSLELLARPERAASEVDDESRGRNQTFLSRAQWMSLLAGAGAEIALCLPDGDEVLAEIGMYVIAARFKADRVRIDNTALTAHLAERLPEYMLPWHLQVVDALPLTANGKVDREVLRAWLPERTATAGGSGVEPDGDLERRLAGVLAGVLGLERVGRDQDFFALGGDSLLAAQLAGRLCEQIPETSAIFFDDLLRRILEGPTVAELAASLAGTEPGLDQAIPGDLIVSPIVPLGGSGEAALHVLVHDGCGTLVPYGALARGLGEHGTVVGLEINAARPYLEIEPEVLVERLASTYSRLLLDVGSQSFHIVGYRFGVLLATELARRLLEAGAKVESLTVIYGYPTVCLVEDDLLVEYLFARELSADPASLGFPAEAALGRALAAILAETGDRVPRGRLASLRGDPELDAVAACFRRLAELALAERLGAIDRAVTAAGSEPYGLERIGVLRDVFRHGLRAAALHRATPYAGDVTLLRCPEGAPLWPSQADDVLDLWRDLCLGELRVLDLGGDPFDGLRSSHVERVVELLVAAPSPGDQDRWSPKR